MDSQTVGIIQIRTMSLNESRKQSNGHYQPSDTEALCFERSPAFWAGGCGAEPAGTLADPELASFFPQQESL